MLEAKHEQCPLQPLPCLCCAALQVIGLCFALLCHAESACMVQLMVAAVVVQGWLWSCVPVKAA